MKKFSQIEEAAPAGHRWYHHGVTLSKGTHDGSQQFKRVTFSTAHPDHAGTTQPDGKYGHHIHPSAVAKIINGHEEIKKLKKDGWQQTQHGRKSSLSKKEVVKAFDEHERNHRETHGKYNLVK